MINKISDYLTICNFVLFIALKFVGHVPAPSIGVQSVRK
jgi:hypothetical protein